MPETPSLFAIVLTAALTNNILLGKFLGMCSFLSCSKQINTALGLGVAVTFVLTGTIMVNHLVYHYLLVPLGLQHLMLIIFIAVIAGCVQFVEMFIERFSPRLYYALGIFLPLITVNCAILGAALFMVIDEYNLLETLAFGFGSGIGWLLAIVLLAGLRKRMGYSDPPKPFRGVAITMILTGIMALAFMGFAGMGQ
ncbi:MAG: NADH:ubiquinone reductase (Na(+)-transporting) subunit E [Pirellulaceae bacterium]|nr:NADH:ubiquinone reductase (Na(+)-transporting) subunit E [Pirellulaceae bacterium]